MAGPIVDVKGLRELDRAFARASADVRATKKKRLEGAARPVARDAEVLALGRISHMPRSPAWSGMRIGSNRDFVYVAPQQRGSRVASKKRRNIADLLIDRAMQPAVDRNAEGVRRTLDEMLARMERAWERG